MLRLPELYLVKVTVVFLHMSDRHLQTTENISLVGMTSHSWRDLSHTFCSQ
jgi:hypothetical protein